MTFQSTGEFVSLDMWSMTTGYTKGCHQERCGKKFVIRYKMPILESAKMSRQDQLWEAYIVSFCAACENKNHEVAEKILHSAYCDAEDYCEIDSRVIMATLRLASVYCSAGLDSHAMHLYRKLVEITEKVLGTIHSESDAIGSFEKEALKQISDMMAERAGTCFVAV